MKTFYLLGFLTMVLFACHDNRYVESLENKINYEEQAIQMVLDFKYDPLLSKAEQPPVKIKSVKREKALTKSSQDAVLSVDLYNIEFESNRGDGFAMVVSDEKLSTMLCYVPEGSLDDTCYIEPMAEMIKGMRNVIAEKLQAKDLMLTTRVNWQYTEIGPLLKTMWHQGKPYNAACPYKSCSDNNGRALTGCCGLASAMVIAYFPTNEALAKWPDLKEYSKVVSLYSSHPLASGIAAFIKNVSDGCGSNYGCDGTGSNVDKVNSFFNTLGYSDKKTRKSSNNLDIAEFLQAIRWNKPTLAAGDKSRRGAGHMWVIDGFRGWRSPSWTTVYTPNDHLFHCNWGWGGDYGWYANCMQADAEHPNYHYSNDFIYFNWPF